MGLGYDLYYKVEGRGVNIGAESRSFNYFFFLYFFFCSSNADHRGSFINVFRLAHVESLGCFFIAACWNGLFFILSETPSCIRRWQNKIPSSPNFIVPVASLLMMIDGSPLGGRVDVEKNLGRYPIPDTLS
ncbi:hypothetical protein OCU04_009509 [Sclerotinia nivalis]|uniref:Uncharacterized protein n=1 Tax=Sclerotinia nivalis TaxID=352851 RepID=A0A9X0AF68_9HELO|nr:hypothetical protein OCU04_009509 [Sclerotinia nivalis]